MNASVEVIMGLFFIIGIMVGVITVVAMSALRQDRQARRGRRGRPPQYERFGQPPDRGWEGAEPDDRPRWPGEADGGYHGR